MVPTLVEILNFLCTCTRLDCLKTPVHDCSINVYYLSFQEGIHFTSVLLYCVTPFVLLHYMVSHHPLFIKLCSLCCTVGCPLLPDPNNGEMTCSLGDDRVPSYKDTCSVTCYTGYIVVGSNTRTCQRDGSWSGVEIICSGGKNSVCYIIFHCSLDELQCSYKVNCIVAEFSTE